MENVIIYTSVAVHLILIYFLWKKIYKNLKPSKSRINITIWIVELIMLIYIYLACNFIVNFSFEVIWDKIFYYPCYLLAFPLIYILLFNLCYTIILLIQKWINTPIKKPVTIPHSYPIDTFETKLGVVTFNVSLHSSEACNITKDNNKTIVSNSAVSIEIIAFQDMKEWLANSNNPIEDSKGWIVRIQKRTAEEINLKINCELKPNNTVIRSDIDSGEHLDSICIESETNVLNIGTEDSEMLKYRAIHEDDMPLRFSHQLGYSSPNISFTNYTDFGFETFVPELQPDENLYFHYLVATNPRKKSKDYPDEDDISTHIAVGFSKWRLTELLRLDA